MQKGGPCFAVLIPGAADNVAGQGDWAHVTAGGVLPQSLRVLTQPAHSTNTEETKTHDRGT